jgi:hypothetical protein
VSENAFEAETDSIRAQEAMTKRGILFVPNLRKMLYLNKTVLCMLEEVARLVEALLHETEDPEFGSKWSPWKYTSDVTLLFTFSSPGGPLSH